MSAPISAPTVSLASIQLQGNAMADIARAIPGLTTLSSKDRSIDVMCILYVRLVPLHSISAMGCDAIIAIL